MSKRKKQNEKFQKNYLSGGRPEPEPPTCRTCAYWIEGRHHPDHPKAHKGTSVGACMYKDHDLSNPEDFYLTQANFSCPRHGK